MDSTFIIAIGIICFAGLMYGQLHNPSLPAPLPPGPKGLPLIGNAADLRTTQPLRTFREWGEKYGPITYVKALGKSIIILNDPQYAYDMFAKKSSIYSDRPELILAGRLLGWEGSRALINFTSPGFTTYRRFFAQFMGTRAKIEAYENVLQDETDAFLKRLVANPTAWRKHTYMFTAAIMLMLGYGHKLNDENDELLKLVTETMGQFSEVTANQGYLVDTFPILQYVPEWVPGTNWKKKIPKYWKARENMLEVPYQWAKQQIAAGIERPSFVSNLISNTALTPENELAIKWAATSIYGAGADTTVAGIDCFFLAMTIHTSEQKIAQAEIDAVVGTGRFPTFADRVHLPYVEAIYLEALRMYPFGPMSIPHVSTEDDVHNGYFIPKGSIIFSIIGQYLKNPDTYKDPWIFNPDRFIASEFHPAEKDPRDYIFSVGRRACPGQHLADTALWIVCASLIATFEISPPLKDGNPVVPPAKFVDETIGTINHPKPFETIIKPRSPTVVEILNSL